MVEVSRYLVPWYSNVHDQTCVSAGHINADITLPVLPSKTKKSQCDDGEFEAKRKRSKGRAGKGFLRLFWRFAVATGPPHDNIRTERKAGESKDGRAIDKQVERHEHQQEYIALWGH
jgi:hypothetical protein